MTGKQKRVLLIGGGKYAYEAHRPAIEDDDAIDLVGIVELQSREDSVKDLWKKQVYPVPDSCDGRSPSGEKSLTQELGNLSSRLPTGIDAVLISTYGCHYQYAKWALQSNWHVLVDKPLTLVHGMATDPLKPRDMVEQFDELVALAGNDLLFSLATQRRYNNPVYGRIAAELTAAQEVTNASVGHVRSIQAFTSDGYFKPDFNYAFGELGGKVKNTGYHVVDIATWLLRKVSYGIDRAVIQVSPLCVDGLAKLGGVGSQDDSPSELYASAQVTFMREDLGYCVLQLHAQHENLCGEAIVGAPYCGAQDDDDTRHAFFSRTKEEEMRVALGPFFRAYFRRLAKVGNVNAFQEIQKLRENRQDCTHDALLEFSRRHEGVAVDQRYSWHTLEYKDPDSAPAEEFLMKIQTDSPVYGAKSPVRDHGAAIRVFAGIYEGIARVHSGDFGPVLVDLRDQWSPPPG